jgi:catechol 2,3-dioxygenase-like lactoylglutathione lyase family enzyme
MDKPKVCGLNHLTLAVADLVKSIPFYRDVLGFELRAEWDDGAYLEAQNLWLCLSLDSAALNADRCDYTHYAFEIEPGRFDEFCDVIQSCATAWKDNSSEGESLYFLDPDNHKLEIHVGSLASRLAHYRANKSRVKIID